VVSEAGFSIHLIRPPVAAPSSVVPPGQGRLLLPLRGEAVVREVEGGGGNVVATPRRAREEELGPGRLFRLANDARWTLQGGSDDTVVLALATSVPRESARVDDLFAQARRRLHMAPVRVFGNESVRVEFTAARGRLPGRGWVPYDHTAEAVEVAVILRGAFRARVGTERILLPAGSLLRIPQGEPHNFAAAGRGLCVGLIVSAVRKFLSASAPREEARSRARGFDPFSRG